MTRYGYMLPANEAGEGILSAIAEHDTTELPQVVPVWSRWTADGGFKLDWRVLDGIRAVGMEPVIYAETGQMHPQLLLSGAHDNDFRLLAARSRGALIRILHEPNGKAGLFAWQSWELGQKRDATARAGTLFHEEGARLAYCVSARGRRNDDMLDAYPGDEFVDVVGFDEFRRSEAEPLPPNAWRYPITRLSLTGKPVWVFETGVEWGLPARGQWMASLAMVQGVAVILVFDYRIEFTVGDELRVDDWLWNKAMRREWEVLPR